MSSFLLLILVFVYGVRTILILKTDKRREVREEAALKSELETLHEQRITLQAEREYFETRRDMYIFEDVNKDGEN